MQTVILAENLGKRFNRYHAKKPLTFMEAVLSGLQRIKAVDQFWALQGVSFEVAAGEMIGIIGHNGAGKSTLLQLLGKVTHPTLGHIKMSGNVRALLDLGAGFHGDLTGRENVVVSAVVAGLSRQEVTRRFDQILEFSELEDFIDNPVRTYSSGMMMRLAFSVAIYTHPQIMLVDEFLSVGDLAFQTKCLNRISDLKEQGCAIVLVSHDIAQVERLCDRVLWLRKGEVVAYGEAAVIVGQYASEMRSQTQSRTPHTPHELTRGGSQLRVNENRFGSLEMKIVDVHVLPISTLNPGDYLNVEVDYYNPDSIDSAIFSITISQENGEVCLDVNTVDLDNSYIRLEQQGTIRFIFDRLDLRPGGYFVDVGTYKQDWSYAYDYHWHVYPLTIDSSLKYKGYLHPPIRCEVIPIRLSQT